jgi:hypothetical protein
MDSDYNIVLYELDFNEPESPKRIEIDARFVVGIWERYAPTSFGCGACTVIDYKGREILVKNRMAYVIWVMSKATYKINQLNGLDGRYGYPPEFEDFLQNETCNDIIKIAENL